MTQLFGDRTVVAQRDRLLVDLRRQPADDALHVKSEGRGVAWSNSLFEDNAEFGLGMRLSIDKQNRVRARTGLRSWQLKSAARCRAICSMPISLPRGHPGTARKRVVELKKKTRNTEVAKTQNRCSRWPTRW